METLKDIADFCKYGNKTAIIRHGKLIGYGAGRYKPDINVHVKRIMAEYGIERIC